MERNESTDPKKERCTFKTRAAIHKCLLVDLISILSQSQTAEHTRLKYFCEHQPRFFHINHRTVQNMITCHRDNARLKRKN